MSSVELSQTIARALADAGTDTVFGMPGGGNNLDFIGAVESAGMRFVLAHAETPAAIMAGVYGDLSEGPGACVVTRGPGAASAVNGVANALLDRQPMVLVTDAVSASDYHRIAHQRIDQRAMFAPVTKLSVTAGRGDVETTVRHTVAAASAGCPGAVHLDFDPSADSTPTDPPAAVQAPAQEQAEELAALLRESRRPVVLLGVGARRHGPVVRTLLEGTHVPVLMTYRGKGVVPDSSPDAAGLVTGATTESPLLHAADLIVMVGVDSVEFIPNAWPYDAPVVSVAAWPDTSPYLMPRVELVGELDKLIGLLAEHWPTTTWPAGAGNAHRDAELARLIAAGRGKMTGLAPHQVVERARTLAPADAIATVDAGAHMLPAMSLWLVEDVDQTLISSGLATMGFALPAAIAAALARPGRRVICFTGDGGLGMCIGELETLHRLGVPVTLIVFNDSRLSLIAIKAKPEGNGGDRAIGYRATDFDAVAEGYGIPAFTASDADEVDAALEAALAVDGPSLVDARVDPASYAQILEAIRGPRDR